MELPDPGTAILMSDPPTSHFVQPLERFSPLVDTPGART